MTKPRWHKIAGWNKIQIDEEQLVLDYCRKVPVEKLAKIHSCAIQTIYGRLKKQGVKCSISESLKGQTPHVGKRWLP